MQNWSRHLHWQPAEIAYPRTEAEVQALVQRSAAAGRHLRVIGSGHSFTPLCVTEDVLLSLDYWQGLESVDKVTGLVTVRAGTKLHTLNHLLHAEGLALENLGDIDRQSIGGTISTGTHGTGLAFGNISTQLRAIRFVNGRGELVECSTTERPDLFRAAQVSLGALGVITAVTLQCVPAYQLELVVDKMRLDEVLQTYPQLNADHRNFEFYWFPNTDYVMTKRSNTVVAAVAGPGLADFFQEYVLENYAFQALCELSYRLPRTSRWVSRLSAATIGHHRKVAHSHQVYATTRLVRFNEMEYNVPLTVYPDAMRALTAWINRHNWRVHFPIENRFVRGDDIYLSPAQGRDSAYIACHVYYKKDFLPYFTALEAILRDHEGRPHWGKWHTMKAAELAGRYPHYQDFNRHRGEQDPEGVFLTSYLAELLG